MVRVVRDKNDHNPPAKPATHFHLGNAFGGDLSGNAIDQYISATQIRIRTLETMNLPAGSLRRPGEIQSGGLFPTRVGSSLYHQLNHHIKNYMQGISDHPANRADTSPGTKFQTQLSPNALNNWRPQHAHMTSRPEEHKDHRSIHHHPAPNHHLALASGLHPHSMSNHTPS
ncbi:hypothetical protein DFP76_10759 [Marinomonas aquiplantarum]|uniref:Uncharacterized protein n=2 Tax=Marinomonas aquiplantarum TaxID=491951 RepID=A0A366CW74_9GAMM|nr:hypothetical protein DFP76_10759 [Marinomonas aquiplantarum]